MTTSGNKNLPRIMKKNGCPQTMTVAQLELFDAMISRLDRKIVGLDGKARNARGLGFEDKSSASLADDKPSSSKLTLMEAWAIRSAKDSHERDACDTKSHISLQKPKEPTQAKKANGRSKRKTKQRHGLPKVAQATNSDQSDSEVWSEEECEKYNLIMSGKPPRIDPPSNKATISHEEASMEDGKGPTKEGNPQEEASCHMADAESS